MTWSTTNSESPWTYSHVAPSSTVMRSPLMRASYFVALFEAKNRDGSRSQACSHPGRSEPLQPPSRVP